MTALITVLGVVQGVGYRPFVARLAQKLNITGTVMNSGGIVRIIANGEDSAMNQFIRNLKEKQPRGADVTRIITECLPEMHYEKFEIIPSGKSTDEIPLLPRDLPMCEVCEKELGDPQNRRYRYPFISCVACGPRYTIINALPYDRENTTMDSFEMCPACGVEYRESGNIRCHAQTISCRDCGPQLILQLPEAVFHKGKALDKGIELLKQGKVLAVKSIGGYQFVCLPTDTSAVENLRLLKHRDRKPFAVMFPNLGAIKACCEVNGQEENLLISAARPIVLLHKKKESFCPGVSGESRFIGAFLVYTPLHRLLTDACGPLVMTSGNLTSEPIITNDEDMLNLRSPYLAGVLYNLREIVTPMDDSVARVVCGKPQLIRRSRGYAPLPVKLRQSAGQTVLAMGGDLKSSFCLYSNDRAYLSQYFGDMENYHVSQAFKENLKRMTEIFGIKPDIIACDMHPQYITAQIAEKSAQAANIEKIQIQHHHAHAASVMAEHNLSSCIAVIFDGTGYGTDGKIWGGEFLLCKGTEFERRAHLNYVTLCGGDTAAKNAGLVTNCYLNAAGVESGSSDYFPIRSAIANNINTQQYSSMGRLFDAVSAVLKLKTENSFEGECAIALENAAAAYEKSGGKPNSLKFKIKYDDTGIEIDQIDLVKTVFSAVKHGADAGALALGFHRAITEMVLDVCGHIRKKSGENAVALSGGVFANLLLTEECARRLIEAGFEVYLNSAVPANDGGISLGQAWLCRNIQRKN